MTVFQSRTKERRTTTTTRPTSMFQLLESSVGVSIVPNISHSIIFLLCPKCLPGKPVACNYGLLSMLYGTITYYFWATWLSRYRSSCSRESLVSQNSRPLHLQVVQNGAQRGGPLTVQVVQKLHVKHTSCRQSFSHGLVFSKGRRSSRQSDSIPGRARTMIQIEFFLCYS